MGKLASWLDKLLYYFVGAAFLALFAVNILNIAARVIGTGAEYFLWTVDFSQLTMIWMVAIGSVVALHRGEHLLISFLKEKLPPVGEMLIDLLTRSVFLVFYLILIVTGLEIAQIRMNIAYVSLGWPTGLAFYSVPVSGVLMVFFTLLSMAGIIRKHLDHRRGHDPFVVTEAE